jgi:hypothetical protein
MFSAQPPLSCEHSSELHTHPPARSCGSESSETSWHTLRGSTHRCRPSARAYHECGRLDVLDEPAWCTSLHWCSERMAVGPHRTRPLGARRHGSREEANHKVSASACSGAGARRAGALVACGPVPCSLLRTRPRPSQQSRCKQCSPIPTRAAPLTTEDGLRVAKVCREAVPPCILLAHDQPLRVVVSAYLRRLWKLCEQVPQQLRTWR